MRLKELAMLVLEIALFLLLLNWLMAEARGDVRRTHELRDHFDIVELNHVYTENGVPRMDQLVFWDWIPDVGYRCQGYWVLDDCRVETEAGKKAWDKVVDNWVRQFDVADQAMKRRLVRYRGEYTAECSGHPHLINGMYMSIMTEKGMVRIVTADKIRVTHTAFDSEMEDRERFPVSQRRGLTKRSGE